jgi:hypothetical protein
VVDFVRGCNRKKIWVCKPCNAAGHEA